MIKLNEIYKNDHKWTFFNKNKIRIFYRLGLITDFLRGTDFYGAQTSHPIIDGHQFTTACYPGLNRRIFGILPKSQIRGIIDIGCGKGLTLVRFRRSGIAKVGGVEFQEELVEICEQNFKKLKLQLDFLWCGNAKDFKGYEGYNTLYLYNALPWDILDLTLSNFISVTKNDPHSKYLISVNPVCHQLCLDKGFQEIGRFFHFATHDDVVVYQLG